MRLNWARKSQIHSMKYVLNTKGLWSLVWEWPRDDGDGRISYYHISDTWIKDHYLYLTANVSATRPLGGQWATDSSSEKIRPICFQISFPFLLLDWVLGTNSHVDEREGDDDKGWNGTNHWHRWNQMLILTRRWEHQNVETLLSIHGVPLLDFKDVLIKLKR